jgi:hypothetical protein
MIVHYGFDAGIIFAIFPAEFNTGSAPQVPSHFMGCAVGVRLYLRRKLNAAAGHQPSGVSFHRWLKSPAWRLSPDFTRAHLEDGYCRSLRRAFQPKEDSIGHLGAALRDRIREPAPPAGMVLLCAAS